VKKWNNLLRNLKSSVNVKSFNDLMILMGENSILGPLAVMVNERRECHSDPKKMRFSRPTPSNGPSNGFDPIKKNH
jgi:hypothetical protein